MLSFKHHIAQSLIPHSGLGLFTDEPIKARTVIIFPNQFHQTYSFSDLEKFPKDSIEYVSAIRWFDQTFSVDPDWSQESHLNHSFNPNCLWHLGFVFALRDIEYAEELTINYSYLLSEETVLDFRDSVTGDEIRGLSWAQKMRETSHQLLNLFNDH